MNPQREWYLWGGAFLCSLLLLGYFAWQWYQISLQKLIPPVSFSHESTVPASEHIEIFSPVVVPSYTTKLILSGIVYSDQPSCSHVVIKDDTGQHNYREGDVLVDMPRLRVKKIKPEGIEIQTPQGVEILQFPVPVYSR